MVGVAQSAERLVVVQKVAGSIPVTHPVETVARYAQRSFLFLLTLFIRCLRVQ